MNRINFLLCPQEKCFPKFSRNSIEVETACVELLFNYCKFILIHRFDSILIHRFEPGLIHKFDPVSVVI